MRVPAEELADGLGILAGEGEDVDEFNEAARLRLFANRSEDLLQLFLGALELIEVGANEDHLWAPVFRGILAEGVENLRDCECAAAGFGVEPSSSTRCEPIRAP